MPFRPEFALPIGPRCTTLTLSPIRLYLLSLSDRSHRDRLFGQGFSTGVFLINLCEAAMHRGARRMRVDLNE